MMGGDFDSNVAQLARENQMMKAAGLLASGTKKIPENKQPEKSDDESGDKGDETEDNDNEPGDDSGESESEDE